MVWEDWLASVAPILGTTTIQAGVILALIFTFAFSIMAAISAPRYADKGIPITSLIFTFLFTYVEWYPIWTGTALSLVLSLWTARVLTDTFTS